MISKLSINIYGFSTNFFVTDKMIDYNIISIIIINIYYKVDIVLYNLI